MDNRVLTGEDIDADSHEYDKIVTWLDDNSTIDDPFLHRFSGS